MAQLSQLLSRLPECTEVRMGAMGHVLWVCWQGKLAPAVPQTLFNLRGLARHYFGEPTSKSVLPNGETRSEWLLDRVAQVPGQYVEQKIFVGYDRDGFPVYYTRQVFVPAHMARQYCRLAIISGKDGKVLEASWEGDSCEDMMAVPSTY